MAEALPPLAYPQHFPDQSFGSAVVQQLYISHNKLGIVPPMAEGGYPDFSQTFQMLPPLEVTFLHDELESVRRRLRPLRRPANQYWGEKAAGVAQNMREWHEQHDAHDLADVFDAGLPAGRKQEVVQYLTWYCHSLIDPDKEVRKRMATIRNEYLEDDLSYLTQCDLLPPHAPAAIMNGVDSVKRFRVIDPFESGYNQHDGEYRPYERALGISALTLNTNDVYATGLHESIHSGTDEGLCKIMPVETTELTWLDEAYVEHLTQVATDESPFVIDPDKRSERKGAYVPERKLLSLMLPGLAEPITLRHLGDAYFEPLVVTSSPRMRLKSLLCQPHPATNESLMGTIGLIAESYNKDELSRYEQEKLLEYWISRFRPRQG